jgi:hypothetical protein
MVCFVFLFSVLENLYIKRNKYERNIFYYYIIEFLFVYSQNKDIIDIRIQSTRLDATYFSFY